MSDETEKAQPYFKMTIDDRVYTYSRLTLEDARLLKRDFDVKFQDYEVTDPDYITGMLFLALREEKPQASVEALKAEAGSIDFLDYITGLASEVSGASVEDDAPLDEADDADSANVKDGTSEETPKNSGPLDSPENTESAPPAS